MRAPVTAIALGLVTAFVGLEPAAAQQAEKPAKAENPSQAKKTAKAEESAQAGKSAQAFESVYEKDVVDLRPDGQDITLVDVDNRLGSVRVEGYDGKSITISAVKRAADAETLERLKVTLIPNPAGPVQISTSLAVGKEARPVPSGSVGIDLVIRAPRAARVEARVWNDRLEVVGMENGAELATNDGDIAVKSVSGTVVTHSSAGAQSIVDVFGAVDAQALAGDVNLASVRGQRLDASAHDGRIESQRIRVHEVTIRTTTGDIRFHGFALAGGRYRISSYRGNVEVAFGHAAPLTVWARSKTGQVTLPDGAETRTPASGVTVADLPGVEGEKTAGPALVEIRSRVGNIQFAVLQ